MNEVKQSEEWETAQMSILSIGLERGQAIGEARGQVIGETRVLTELIVKKMKKGNTPEQIAEILEIDLSIVRKICSLAEKYAPDYDIQKISEDYQKNKAE